MLIPSICGRQTLNDVNKIAVRDILQLITRGDDIINSYTRHDDIILVLRYNGSEKSSFVSSMANGVEYVCAEKMNSNIRHFSDKDISNIIPHLVVAPHSRRTYYDCLAFGQGTCDLSEASTYFIKKILDSATSIKIVFTIGYQYVTSRSSKREFLNMVKHASTMLKNFDKLSKSFAMIATKVKGEPSKDETMTTQVAKFIESTRSDLKQRYSKNATAFVDALLQQNRAGAFLRIGLFREPDCNKIEDLSLPQKIIHQNIKFVKCNENDFTISVPVHDKCRSYTKDLSRKVREHASSNVKQIANEIHKHYLSYENTSKDLIRLKETFEQSYSLLSKTITNSSATSFITNLKDALGKLNLSMNENVNLRSVTKYKDFLDFLNTITNSSFSDWKSSFLDILEYLNRSTLWYDFSIDLFQRSRTYEVQKDNFRTRFKFSQPTSIHDLRNFLKTFLNSTLPPTIARMRVEPPKLQSLTSIFKVTVQKLIVTRSNNTLTIRGPFLKLSDLVKLEQFNDEKITTIRLFAMDTVFLDDHVNLTGREIKLFILSPRWHFIGEPHIILNGCPGERHPTNAPRPTGAASQGCDGLPGNPGGPAGHLFGIGQDFIDMPTVLHIEVHGGRGGPGQKGSPGVDGDNGEDCYPLQLGKWWSKRWHTRPFLQENAEGAKELFQDKLMYTHSNKTDSAHSIKIIGMKIPVKRITYKYFCIGKNGKSGGRGGNGGAGGVGGHKGNTEMIDISGRIVFKYSGGEHGPVGDPGSGEMGGIHGEPGMSYEATFVEDRIPLMLFYRRPKIHNVPMPNKYKPERSSPGVKGKNKNNRREARKLEFENPIRNILDYKSFAREFIAYAEISPCNLEIRNFIKLVESHHRVEEFYDTKAFVYELLSLENQFYALQTKMEVLFLYESLARRIIRYAERFGENLSQKDKAILSYVYSTTLSKSCALKRERNFLPMDFKRYSKNISIEIKKLNRLNHLDMINEYKNRYENIMTKKIEEVRYFIDDIIIPTIEASFKNTETAIKKLLDENKKYKDINVENQIKLKKILKKLGGAVVLRGVLNILQMGGHFLQFLGPVGSIVGPAVGATSVVIESLTMPNTDLPNEDSRNLTHIKVALKRNSEWLQESQKKYRHQMSYIARQVENIEKTNAVDLTYVKNEIKLFNKKLDQLKVKEETPFWMIARIKDEFEIKLCELLQEKETELQTRDKTKVTNQMRAIKTLKRVLERSSDVADVINQIESNTPKESMIESQLEDIEDELKKLREYEKVISGIFIPLCEKVYNEIKIWQEQLKWKSRVDLRISQWNMQYTLRKIKKIFKEMSEGYKSQGIIVEVMEQMEEGLTMLVDMYDRIQEYHEKVELKAYLANVNSYHEFGSRIVGLHDPEINRLNIVIRSNVILTLFDDAMDAFKHSVFPFAHFYMEDATVLPQSLRIGNSTDDLVREATTRINNLNEKILQVSTQLHNRYDNSIMQDIPFTFDQSLTPAFFVWSFRANNNVIRKLLSGTTVTLTSDITKTVIDDNAVKFKNLRIRFILTSKKGLQTLLDKLLENFIFELTHSGEMLYRCGKRFYFFKCSNTKIVFSFKMNNKGEPEKVNRIYGRIKDNYYALSPYTTWNVKLVKNKYWPGDYRVLGKFVKFPMKIALEGLGEYVKRDIDDEVCNNKLSMYYNSVVM